MEKILFLAHTEADGTLSRVSLETLTAAKELAAGTGAELSAGIVGGEVGGTLAALAGAGVKRCLTVAGPEFAQSRYGSDAAAIEAVAKAVGATVIVAGGDSRFSRVLPGVAFRLGGRIDTHLTGLAAGDGKPMATRWYYRQRMLANLSRTQRPWVLTVDSGCFEPWQAQGGAPAAEAVTVDLPAGCVRTKVTGIQAPPADEQTIRPDAELLFVAGAGWTKKQADGQPRPKDAERHILGFITKTKSSLGSSKSLVDLSGEGQSVLPFLSHLHQVGQTGSTPRHAKGLATCCHGEEPHVVGWRFIKERRAVNLDAGCGWAQGKADVLYVADAFKVMEKVNELLEKE
jgi:electron transfer flavoprotein alpha subunit